VVCVGVMCVCGVYAISGLAGGASASLQI